MARVRVDLRISGQLSNDEATRFEAAIASLETHCREHGLEVRSTGCDIHLDADADVSVVEPAAVPATSEEPITEPPA